MLKAADIYRMALDQFRKRENWKQWKIILNLFQ